ncbi:MAG TPA: UDP-2,3-diacylglucosamine diphosphatase [Bacteroidota bacterium]|nr:UDP-2,3-diacylglucosamine diphosphatase [Bacteroidota bacterium]
MNQTFASGASDAVIISDLHLGSANCRDREIVEFLERLRSGEIPVRRLILNGDVFDSIDFRRLNKRHWKILSLLRKLSDRISITWVCGNHDGPAEMISHLLGVEVVDEYIFESGGRAVLVLHGHRFDDFIDTYPRITLAADLLYRFLQTIDRSHRFARFAKSNSKIFLRCAEKIRVQSVSHAQASGCDIVCCGHTHHAEQIAGQFVEYHNSGCWTESPCTYLDVNRGRVLLRTFVPAGITEQTDYAETAEPAIEFALS